MLLAHIAIAMTTITRLIWERSNTVMMTSTTTNTIIIVKTLVMSGVIKYILRNVICTQHCIIV